jgi:hypothetical protein
MALSLLRSSLAPSIYANYNSILGQLFAFCNEEIIHPVPETHATMVRDTTWLRLHCTVTALLLQPYFFSVNKFLRDHQQPPMAVGELLADAIHGLVMRQERLAAADARLPLSATMTVAILEPATHSDTN